MWVFWNQKFGLQQKYHGVNGNTIVQRGTSVAVSYIGFLISGYGASVHYVVARGNDQLLNVFQQSSQSYSNKAVTKDL